jgi:hypothetical protein
MQEVLESFHTKEPPELAFKLSEMANDANPPKTSVCDLPTTD